MDELELQFIYFLETNEERRSPRVSSFLQNLRYSLLIPLHIDVRVEGEQKTLGRKLDDHPELYTQEIIDGEFSRFAEGQSDVVDEAREEIKRALTVEGIALDGALDVLDRDEPIMRHLVVDEKLDVLYWVHWTPMGVSLKLKGESPYLDQWGSGYQLSRITKQVVRQVGQAILSSGDKVKDMQVGVTGVEDEQLDADLEKHRRKVLDFLKRGGIDPGALVGSGSSPST